MKHCLYLACFLLISSLLTAQDVLPKPNPPKLVVDNAHILSPDQQNILEQKLDALNDSSSNQIAVVTIPTLNDVPVEDYANKLFRQWGIGGSKHNNGVLLLIAADDHKVRIEVGYGLEGAITDVMSHDIIENDITPNFKQQNYYEGIDEATNSLSKAAVGEYKERGTQNNNDNKGGGGSILGFIILVVIMAIIFGRNRNNRGGGMVSRRGFGSWLIPGLLLGGWGNGNGGNWSGGGFGGGSGGGGFGGFGGGSSGGGGASGGW